MKLCYDFSHLFNLRIRLRGTIDFSQSYLINQIGRQMIQEVDAFLSKMFRSNLDILGNYLPHSLRHLRFLFFPG